MKISGEKPVGLEAYLQKVDSKGEAGSKGVKKVSGETTLEENVQLSDKAKDIKKIKEILEATPDIRQEKIDQIKTALDNGTYNVEGKKIAEKIIKESLIDLVL